MKICICYDDGVGPVTHEACPQHGRTLEAQQLKAAFEEIERYPLFLQGPGPWTADEDANGVVHLKDGTGSVRALMPKDVFEDIQKYYGPEKQHV